MSTIINNYNHAFYDSANHCEYTPEQLLCHEAHAYCPTREELQDYASRHAEHFLYEEPVLLSPDRKIMYGYSAEGLQELVIPDDVEVYDNLCEHSAEEENSYYVSIGISLRCIVDVRSAFGLHNLGFEVGENPYLTVIDDMLYSKDGSRLIAYPSGKMVPFDALGDRDDCYVQLPLATKRIEQGAFKMLLLPHTVVIPDSVQEIEDGAFLELYDKGIYMTRKDVTERSLIIPRRFEEVVNRVWKEDAYERPRVIYY